MFARLLLAFIIIPFVELVLLLRMADATSWMTTLSIVIVTGLIGSYLARREGLAAIGRFRAALAEGRMPGREIQDGLMIAFAAALLLTPGLLTDALGFVLLTPMGRTHIGGFLRRRYGGKFQVHTHGFGTSDSTESTLPPRSRHENGNYTVDSPSYGPKQSSTS
ncbi:FxsA family protein [Neorhodopirellula pilleata]|uniref:Phage T7 F exclusion suppressor FxsA n=1 Tax=Neorhodopirellula pilleata TaxID=2714738 RepID=A0A5C6AVF3_9BACT|nr:FxsA family protein [Neorhodopirellula pilleata]TWU02104.1 phage T7 F exclusion suppressor FxsA [Neorhodopirellula pilleata]